jgi:hypothetical protein
MAREIDVELARYKSIREYVPQVGDIIIKHGWIWAKTKWFGIVNNVNEDGSLNVIKEGLPCLLFTTPQSLLSKKTVSIDPAALIVKGSYTAVQQDSKANQAIWYV